MRLGFFDSGVGAKTVENALAKRYQFDALHYTASHMFPLGNRTKEEIVKAAHEGIAWLLTQNVDHIVIACHTASVYVQEHTMYTRICDFANEMERDSDDLVICTQATFDSGWYQKKGFRVLALPELAGFIEHNQKLHAMEYLQKNLDKHSFSRLLLCSTHYPTLADKEYHKALGKVFSIVNPAEYINLDFKRITS